MEKGNVVISVLLVCALLFVLVRGFKAERILHIPMMEVGGVWLDTLCGYCTQLFTLLRYPKDVYSVLAYVGCAAALVVLYYLHNFLFVPYNRVKLLGEVGYVEESTFSKKEIANMVRKRRLVGDVPPVYPNGWFGLIESFRLEKGKSANISVLGKEITL